MSLKRSNLLICGFSDAESNFSIQPKYTNAGTVSKFSFMLTIELQMT